MNSWQRSLIVAIAAGSPFHAASLPIQAITMTVSAAQNNVQPIHIFVRMSNFDGTPKTNATVIAPFTGWTLSVLSAPPSFYKNSINHQAKDAFNHVINQQLASQSYLAISTISPIGKGVYEVQAQPINAAKGAPAIKEWNPWVTGEYLVRVSFSDNQNTADIMNTFTIKNP